MKNSQKDLYTTGEFAQLCGVKKQTLFHYDDIGLLCPKEKGSNGYRLYSYEQYQDFLLISCLKEANMSLSEIKDYLEDEDEAHKEMVIQSHLIALDKRISYLMRVRKILASSFTAGRRAVGVGDDNDDLINITQRAEQTFWRSKRLDVLDDKELVEYISALIREVQPVCSCIAAAEAMQGQIESPHYFLMTSTGALPKETLERLGLTEFVRPSGRYAITYQQAGEEASNVYQRLINSMNAFDETPGEYFYEELINENAAGEVAPLIVSVQLHSNTIKEDSLYG